MSLTKKIIIALILGVVVGIGFSFAPENIFSVADTYVLNPVGQIFLNLIMMIVVPIVFVSIVLGTAGLGEPAKLGKIGIQTVSFFLVTTAVALTIGLGVGLILEPGKAGVFDTSNAEFNEQGPPPIMETVIN